MSSTGTWNLYIISQSKQTGPLCNLRKEVDVICPQISVEESSDLDRCFYERDFSSDRRWPLSSVDDKSYSGLFHLCAIESLASWFLLVASSSIFLSKNVNFFYGFRLHPAKKVSFPERTNLKADNTSQKILKYEKAAVCAESSSVHDAYTIDSPLSCSGNSGSSYECSSENSSTPLSTKSDSSSEILDLDRANYWDSLLNLEGEDCEWISDFKPSGCLSENPSTPLSTKGDSSSEVSDLDKASYWDSLLNLEGEDYEWISDLKPYGCSSENPSTPLSTKCDSSSEVSDLDKASYWDSLLNLEEEDHEWISDLKHYGCSSENPSTPLCTKCDSASEVSDLDRATYLDSLLSLEGEDSEWISDSKAKLEYFQNGFPSPSYKSSWGSEVRSSVSNISGVQGKGSEDTISVEDLLETADMEQFGADEPIFWPFEGEFNWNSEESVSSFSISPRKQINYFGTPDKSFGSKLLEEKLELKKGCRRRLDFGFRSTTSRMKEWKQKGDEAECRSKSEPSKSSSSMLSKSSAKIAPLESKDEIDVLKPRVAPRIKSLSAGKNSLKKKFASNKELPLGRGNLALDEEIPIETLVGLKEFDAREGVDSEFNGNVFLLDESL